ncbi:hypothetical protein ACQP1O_18270 [Nocardia sp. CA-151230]|uniref:hypothetical protein n=1 Tax=Nocardia sp. CA-151230 TaxID=3239982 RepID=UPI003D8EC176
MSNLVMSASLLLPGIESKGTTPQMSDPYGKPGQQDSNHLWPNHTTTEFQQPAPGYRPQPGYGQQPGYAPPQGYAPHPGYALHPAYAPQYAPQPGMPPIVINNVASAAATAIAGGYGRRRRQSFIVHLTLLLLTAGLGNIIYAWYVIDWNKKHGY